MSDLSSVETWCNAYGLMSIELLPENVDDCNSFVMLNGGYGNFCLNVKAEDRKSHEAYNSLSWSSNTGSFVVFNTDNIYLYDWKRSNPETIPRQQVEENFNDFYRYIIKNSHKSSDDIVPFIIDIFRSFRNLLTSDKNSLQALNLLFALLIGIEKNEDDINFEKWGLEDENIEIPSNFDFYTDKLRNGFQNRKPDLAVIIKHSAGVLFQEAQKEVLYFDRQLDFYGLSSNQISLKRNRYSSFHYTPSYLARSIVENVLKYLDTDKGNLKILDPACGSSEFLVEILKQLYHRKYKGSVHIIGWDSSEIAVKISRFRLLYEQKTLWNEKLNFKIEYSDDSLGEIWDNDYDLILMNPPFVSWEKMDNNSRDLVNQVFIENKVVKPNQASAFFYKSIQSLNSLGVIGCVIPSSFLNLSSYARLRYQIIELINIKFLAKLGNFIFEDALTDVSLIIGCKHDAQEKINSPYILWTRNEKNIAQSALKDLRKMQFEKSPKCIKKEYSIYQPARFPITSESWNLISFQEYNLLEDIQKFILQGRLVIVKDIFNVRQGIRTGDNRVFKITNQRYLELPKEERKFFRPVIENKSIKNGIIIADNHSYVWYPYDQTGLMINSETQLKEKVPVFFQTLLLSKDILIKKSRRESCWWKLSEHRAWLIKNEPRLISTEFGKSDSFAFDEKGIFAIERGNAWLPKKKFDDSDYYFYLCIFSSPFFDTLLSIYSKQLLSGWDLGNTHTKNIPIPNVHSSGIRDSVPYIKLVEMGKELSQGNFHLRVMLDEMLLTFFYPND